MVDIEQRRRKEDEEIAEMQKKKSQAACLCGFGRVGKLRETSPLERISCCDHRIRRRHQCLMKPNAS